MRQRSCGDRQDCDEHERFADRYEQRAEGSDHRVRRPVLPPAGAVREVFVEPDGDTGEYRHNDRRDDRRSALRDARAKPSEQANRRVAELDDDARPRERHPDRRRQQHHVARSQIVEASVADAVDEPPIDDQLECAGNDAHPKQRGERRAAALRERFTGRCVECRTDEKPEIGAHRSAGRRKRRERGDERQHQSRRHAGEPHRIRRAGERIDVASESGRNVHRERNGRCSRGAPCPIIISAARWPAFAATADTTRGCGARRHPRHAPKRRNRPSIEGRSRA